jgi:hypothetical protein
MVVGNLTTIMVVVDAWWQFDYCTLFCVTCPWPSPWWSSSLTYTDLYVQQSTARPHSTRLAPNMHMLTNEMPMPSQSKTRHTMHYRSPKPITHTHPTLYQPHNPIYRVHILPWQIPGRSPHPQTHQIRPTNQHHTKQRLESQPLNYHHNQSKRSYPRTSYRKTNQTKNPKAQH